MELTGKAKVEFENWRERKYKAHCKNYDSEIWEYYGHSKFKEIPFDMQWEIYMEFFRDLGYDIKIKTASRIWIFYIWYGDIDVSKNDTYYNTREDAQKEALKKANILYNEKHFVFPDDLPKEPISKEKQKELITEIMKEDQKDGLYD